MVYSAHMGEEWGDYIGVETLIDVLKYGHILFSKFTDELLEFLFLVFLRIALITYILIFYQSFNFEAIFPPICMHVCRLENVL